MLYPQQSFPNIDTLRNYINLFIIPNGSQLINGIEHNNVENGLLDFIVQSTVNYNLATIVNGGGTITLTSGITIFSAVPSLLYWGDNFYNEWYIVNRTSDVIPLNPGLTYVDQYGDTQTEVPAGQVLHIVKMTNGFWAQASNIGGGGADIPNTGETTDSIIVDATGGFGRQISATLKVSEEPNNGVQILDDGIFVDESAGGSTNSYYGNIDS